MKINAPTIFGTLLWLLLVCGLMSYGLSTVSPNIELIGAGILVLPILFVVIRIVRRILMHPSLSSDFLDIY